MHRRIPLMALILLASCESISPEARVRDRLVEAGVKPPMAACLAEKLVHHLSDEELHRLARAARLAEDRKVGDMMVKEFVDRASAVGDPHIVEVVTRAGLSCAISS